MLLPATSHREAEEGEWREGVVVEGKGAGVEIRSSASEGGALLLRFHPPDSVWVALSAQGGNGGEWERVGNRTALARFIAIRIIICFYTGGAEQ